MKETKLTKREYKGEGYVHFFTDVEGKEVAIPTTKEEYESLGQEGGAKNNPKVEGLIWTHSCGGTIAVDTPTTVLGENEYCEYGEKYIVNLRCDDGKMRHFDLTKDKIKENKLWL